MDESGFFCSLVIFLSHHKNKIALNVVCPTWPRITKRDQFFSQSVQQFNRGHMGDGGSRRVRAHGVTGWRRAPFKAKPLKGREYSALHRQWFSASLFWFSFL